MRRLSILVCVAAAVAVAPGAATADHGCNGDITDLGVAYVDDRGDVEPWIYAESNNQPGLQSGGDNLFGFTDTCHHDNHDTAIY